MAATLRRLSLVALAALTGCTTDSPAPSASAPPSAAPPSAPAPSRFASAADIDACGILTAAEQKDLAVRPGSPTHAENSDSCGWLTATGFGLFDVRVWKQSAGLVMGVLGGKSDAPAAKIYHIWQIRPAPVNGRGAFQYRRGSEGAPPGACGVFLVVDDASSVQIEWHAGSPCEGDPTKDQWDRVVAAIESRLPPAR